VAKWRMVFEGDGDSKAAAQAGKQLIMQLKRTGLTVRNASIETVKSIDLQGTKVYDAPVMLS
jgi:hypothetical protein